MRVSEEENDNKKWCKMHKGIAVQMLEQTFKISGAQRLQNRSP
jgi:hypothetical protein